MTLDLVTCIIHELMSSPSSRATTPSTPLSASNRIPGRSPASTPIDTHLKSPINGFHSTEQIVLDVVSAYLQFFTDVVREGVVEGGGRQLVFSAACQVLVLLARLGCGLEIVMEDYKGEYSITVETGGFALSRCFPLRLLVMYRVYE